MAGEVVGELSMPVSKHLPQQARRSEGVDPIGDTCAPGVDGFEAVFVSPPPDQSYRKRTQPVTGERIDEACRRIVGAGLMLRVPPQAAGQS